MSSLLDMIFWLIFNIDAMMLTATGERCDIDINNRYYRQFLVKSATNPCRIDPLIIPYPVPLLMCHHPSCSLFPLWCPMYHPSTFIVPYTTEISRPVNRFPEEQVFRFDQGIAHVANVLVGLKGETRPLLGCPGKISQVTRIELSLTHEWDYI